MIPFLLALQRACAAHWLSVSVPHEMHVSSSHLAYEWAPAHLLMLRQPPAFRTGRHLPCLSPCLLPALIFSTTLSQAPLGNSLRAPAAPFSCSGLCRENNKRLGLSWAFTWCINTSHPPPRFIESACTLAHPLPCRGLMSPSCQTLSMPDAASSTAPQAFHTCRMLAWCALCFPAPVAGSASRSSHV